LLPGVKVRAFGGLNAWWQLASIQTAALHFI